MAKTEAPQPRKSRSGQNWLPIGIAIITVGLFLGWLATREPDTAVAVTEPGEPTADTIAGEAPAAPPTAIQPDQLSGAAARDLIGQNVELSSVPITSTLGPQLFWIELPGGSPFLVKLDEALVGRGTQVQAGRSARIVGRVLNKDEALLEQWQQAGVLRNEGDRMQAEYGTTYIEASQVQPAAS